MINTEKAIKFLEDQELTKDSYPYDDLQEHIARQMQKYADQQLILYGVVKSLKEKKLNTFELWMENKGYRQNNKKQWLKHVYIVSARALNNFKLEYESL